jgi:hypothetical protein
MDHDLEGVIATLQALAKRADDALPPSHEMTADRMGGAVGWMLMAIERVKRDPVAAEEAAQTLRAHWVGQTGMDAGVVLAIADMLAGES